MPLKPESKRFTFVLFMLLVVVCLFAVQSGKAMAQALTLGDVCPDIPPSAQPDGLPFPIVRAEFRHPETRDEYEVSEISLLDSAAAWELTPYTDYENASGVPLMQLSILRFQKANTLYLLVYEVDAETVAPAIWTHDHLFENADSEAAQHPPCGWYTMPRADLDHWLAEVTATVQPEPRGYLIFEGRVYR